MSKRTTQSSTQTSTTTTKIPTDPTEIQTQLQSSFRTLLDNYSSIPPRLKLIDSFLLFFILSGVLQFAYRLLITAYPYNAFIGGWVFFLSLVVEFQCAWCVILDKDKESDGRVGVSCSCRLSRPYPAYISAVVPAIWQWKADDQIRINSRSILSLSRSKSPNITRKRGRVQRGFTREVSLGHVIKSPVLMIRAFADFCLSSVILHVFAFNFLG
jgi:hypothetical protein